MTNCVHPKIVWEALSHPFNQCDAVRTRFRGIQANTSSLSYDMLDASQALHTSDPDDLARWMIRLNDRIPVKIYGGCCGTDGRHMEAIAEQIRQNFSTKCTSDRSQYF